ncbi:MAG: 50S ribosomal protein L13 [Verrucomicrobiota bacterium JB024]|nr:50S ribosomal protein L13 [Verrucomicrobiota bacterium JB024]
MKTTLAKPDIDRKWYVVDASGQTLGRLAVKIANVLRGRHKPIYTPHIDAGDYVVVINADKVKLTGRKEEQKMYMFYSGWFGNEYYRSAAAMREKKPAFLIEHAVKGMLPRNKLANAMIKKLKVYAGEEHPHEAQQPITFEG